MMVLIITMSSVAELRAQLKALRSETNSNKALSKMRKSDISEEIQRLNYLRQTTPEVASFPIKSHEMPKNIKLATPPSQSKPTEPKPKAKKNPIIPLESGEMSEVNYTPAKSKKSVPVEAAVPKKTPVGKMVAKKNDVSSLAEAIKMAFA